MTGPRLLRFSIRPAKLQDHVEIHFNRKPDAQTRDVLKAAGFRWSYYFRCWYGKREQLPAEYTAEEEEQERENGLGTPTQTSNLA